jgi:hypothetical protein
VVKGKRVAVVIPDNCAVLFDENRKDSEQRGKEHNCLKVLITPPDELAINHAVVKSVLLVDERQDEADHS